MLSLYFIALPHDDNMIPLEAEQFLINHACKDHLSMTSFVTYTKDKPQVTVQNTSNATADETEHNCNWETMYPVMSDSDNEDNEYVSCTPCVSSNHDHHTPSTFSPSSNYQKITSSGTVYCCHPTKHPRT